MSEQPVDWADALQPILPDYFMSLIFGDMEEFYGENASAQPPPTSSFSSSSVINGGTLLDPLGFPFQPTEQPPPPAVSSESGGVQSSHWALPPTPSDAPAADVAIMENGTGKILGEDPEEAEHSLLNPLVFPYQPTTTIMPVEQPLPPAVSSESGGAQSSNWALPPTPTDAVDDSVVIKENGNGKRIIEDPEEAEQMLLYQAGFRYCYQPIATLLPVEQPPLPLPPAVSSESGGAQSTQGAFPTSASDVPPAAVVIKKNGRGKRTSPEEAERRREMTKIKNRISAARSRSRKQEHIENLEQKANALKIENSWLRILLAALMEREKRLQKFKKGKTRSFSSK